MHSGLCVKKSVSLPQELWDFIEKVKHEEGHGQASKVIHQALRKLRRSRARQKGVA